MAYSSFNLIFFYLRFQVRLFDGKNPVNNKSPATSSSSVWYDDGSTSDTAPSLANTTPEVDQSPVRPPRRRCSKPVATFVASSAGVGVHSGPAKRSHSLTAGVTSTSAEIKSILKKPASLTTDDLSPVRSRAAIAPSPASPLGAAASAGSGDLRNGPQKKAKKQVQFDIGSVAAEKPKDEPPVAEQVVPEKNHVSPTASPTHHRPKQHQRLERPDNLPIGKLVKINEKNFSSRRSVFAIVFKFRCAYKERFLRVFKRDR